MRSNIGLINLMDSDFLLKTTLNNSEFEYDFQQMSGYPICDILLKVIRYQTCF